MSATNARHGDRFAAPYARLRLKGRGRSPAARPTVGPWRAEPGRRGGGPSAEYPPNEPDEGPPIRLDRRLPPTVTTANGFFSGLLPSEKRKVAGSIPALATRVYRGQSVGLGFLVHNPARFASFMGPKWAHPGPMRRLLGRVPRWDRRSVCGVRAGHRQLAVDRRVREGAATERKLSRGVPPVESTFGVRLLGGVGAGIGHVLAP